MQRLHPDDLTGMLLQESPDEWHVLSLPAIAEHEQAIQIGANQHHVRRIGDLFHAEREPQSVLNSLRAQLGPDTFTAQYQQCPIPAEGVMIKREWIQRYDQLPKGKSDVIQSWDTASKDGGKNDYSVCTTWLRHDKKYYLMHVLRGQFNYPALKTQAISHAKAYEPAPMLIEDAARARRG